MSGYQGPRREPGYVAGLQCENDGVVVMLKRRGGCGEVWRRNKEDEKRDETRCV